MLFVKVLEEYWYLAWGWAAQHSLNQGASLPCSASLVGVATRGKGEGEESAQGSWDPSFLCEVPLQLLQIDLQLGVACSPLRGRSSPRGPPRLCAPLAGCCSESVSCQMTQCLGPGPTLSLLCLSFVSLRK